MEPTKPTTAMEAEAKREEEILAKVHRDYLSLYERRSKLYFDSFDPCITLR